MKRLGPLLVVGWLALLAGVRPLHGEDMRTPQMEERAAREALLRKAAEELQAAEREAAAVQERIVNDQRQKEIGDLTAAARALEEEETRLTQKLSATDGVIRELVGLIRVTAKDVAALWRRNLQSALAQHPVDSLEAIAEQSVFPGMEDVRRMLESLDLLIGRSGEVALGRGTIVNRAGQEVEAELLTLGCFTAAYRWQNEIGFLSYSEAGQKFYALSRLPARRVQKQIARYMAGADDAVPVDISRGAAVHQLAHELHLWELIPKGGPIVWPILAILAVGIAIVVERMCFLQRKRGDAEGLMQRIAALAGERRWQDCREACPVITRFGTGDPRMMSGGTSEALVTTMLGLSVAIPIMLAHTLLNRAVDMRIGQMEEKALALVNNLHKSRDANA